MPPRIGLFSALVLVLFGTPSVALAGGGESVSLPTPNPDRFLSQNGKYVDVTDSPRPQNHNPTGVNYTDCEQDLRLDFPIVVSGFDPADSAHLEVWAGATSVDCTEDANRASESSGATHGCWQVTAPTAPLNAVSDTTMTISVFARDVLHYEQPPSAMNAAQPYEPAFHDGANGESACHVQPSDAAVSLNIAFIPVSATAQAIGTSFTYPLDTDLVAPAPPPHVSVTGGSGLLDVTWTPAAPDPDDIGFAVWTAPSQNGSCGAPALQAAEWTLASGEGISVISPQYLAAEVDNPMGTNLTQTNVAGGTRYAVVVTSVDGSGNYGPTSPAACAEPTASSTPPSTVKAGCGCAAAGSHSTDWTFLPAVAALAVTLARRRASRRCTIGACADGSPS